LKFNVIITYRAAQVCRLLLALAIYTSFSLFMYVGFDIIWNHLNFKRFFVNQKHPTVWEYVCRTLLVCFVCEYHLNSTQLGA